jgi:hypothetical protein
MTIEAGISPGARCVNCRTRVPPPTRPISKNGYVVTARKKFCSPECEKEWRKNPVCGRCLLPIKLRYPAERFHDTCKSGCKVCGKHVTPRGYRNKISRRVMKASDDYCSEKCMEDAWRGLKFPECARCGEEVAPKNYDDPDQPTTLRDPGRMHSKCAIEWHENLREDAEEQGDEYDLTWEHYKQVVRIKQKHYWFTKTQLQAFCDPEDLPMPTERQPWPRGLMRPFNNELSWDIYFGAKGPKHKLGAFDYLTECQRSCEECYPHGLDDHYQDWYFGREDGW